LPFVDEPIHSCHTKTDSGDAIVIKVHRHNLETKEITPELKVVQNPSRSFYITKPQFRTHKYKREWERLDRLDRYIVKNHDLEIELDKALNGYTRGNPRLRQLCNSPYVYGADIDIQVLVKRSMQDEFKKSKLPISKITTGFLDIEASMLSDDHGMINLISVTHENKVYTAILDKFFYRIDPITNKRIKGNIDELDTFCKGIFKEYIDKYGFTFEYYVGENQLDLVKWILSKIHENKTDFIGIWNLSYDIKQILSKIEECQIHPKDIFSPSFIAKHTRYTEYKEDTKEVDHFTLKWHMLNSTNHAQFIDSMCLYSILRIVKGKETEYGLNFILINEGIGGKLTFKDEDPKLEKLSKQDWHRYMQPNKFYEYIAYNQWDTMSLQILEWKNHDITAMTSLIKASHVSSYNKTTRRVTDSLHFFCLEKDLILSTAGSNMLTEFDKLLTKSGGAVAKPENTFELGMKIFSDAPNITTYITAHCADSDYSGLYPNNTASCNISRETNISTAVLIEGMDAIATQKYHSLLINLPTNSVQIGMQYLELGGYEDVEEAFIKEFGL
jgi:hypothetical protein